MILFITVTCSGFTLLLGLIALGIWSVFSVLCDIRDLFKFDPDAEMDRDIVLDSTGPDQSGESHKRQGGVH